MIDTPELFSLVLCTNCSQSFAICPDHHNHGQVLVYSAAGQNLLARTAGRLACYVCGSDLVVRHAVAAQNGAGAWVPLDQNLSAAYPLY